MASDVKFINDATSIVVEKNQESIIYTALDAKQCNLEIQVKQGGNLELLTYNNQNAELYMHVNLAENTNVNIYNVAITDEDIKMDLLVDMGKANAIVNIMNVYLANKSAIINSDININHSVEYTSSSLETYAIAKDSAKIILNNNATIVKGAKKAIVRQSAKGLNLDRKASIIAQPNLFIDEFDVEAGHSAAIGSVNKEDLFYLMSRGLNESEARKIIVMGFVQPLLDKIKTAGNSQAEKLKEQLLERFSTQLK